MFIMKRLIEVIRKNAETIKTNCFILVSMVIMCALLFLSAILQGCTVSRGTTIKGKARIITVDTTIVNHNGAIKFKKSMFNR